MTIVSATVCGVHAPIAVASGSLEVATGNKIKNILYKINYFYVALVNNLFFAIFVFLSKQIFILLVKFAYCNF